MAPSLDPGAQAEHLRNCPASHFCLDHQARILHTDHHAGCVGSFPWPLGFRPPPAAPLLASARIARSSSKPMPGSAVPTPANPFSNWCRPLPIVKPDVAGRLPLLPVLDPQLGQPAAYALG